MESARSIPSTSSHSHSPELGDGETSARNSDSPLDDEENVYDLTKAEQLEEECKTNKHVKPPYSYIALITMAVLQVISNLNSYSLRTSISHFINKTYVIYSIVLFKTTEF